MTDRARVLVVGAGAPLGFAIVEDLVAAGHRVTAAYRTDRPGLTDRLRAAGADPVQLDLSDTPALRARLEHVQAAVFTPILTESAGAAAHLRPDQGALFFSSNNVSVDAGNALYGALLKAEAAVRLAAPQAVILRPTMIYGHPADRNLSRLMRAAARRPVLFCPATAARQQPVFFRDLAKVAAAALTDPARAGQVVAVGGPDVLTYRRLFRAVARAAGRRPLILPVPLAAAGVALALWARLGLSVPVSAAQIARAGRDKHAVGAAAIVTGTSLEDGLKALADTL